MTYNATSACRSCDTADLRPILDLGTQPLANSYPELGSFADEPRYPLAIVRCGACSLVQLAGQVDPRLMFDDYLYFSSYSNMMLESASALTTRLITSEDIGPYDLVVEVASNDGYLLKSYLECGIQVLGIEPAANVADVARDAGVDTVVEYFGRDSAEDLVAAGRQARILHANNVIAHVPDINDFVGGVARLLLPHGIAVIETPWLVEMLRRCEFDTIYHEHVFYHSLTSFETLFARHGLEVVDAELISLHGGSLRLTVAHRGMRQRRAAVDAFLSEERDLGVTSDACFTEFAGRVDQLRVAVRDALLAHKQAGRRIAAYGAAAKGTVLLNHFDIDGGILDYVVDRSPHKQGRRMPGVGVPIVDPARLLEDRPDITLLLAWNFEAEILAQQEAYRAVGGRFLVPIPEPRLV